MGLSLAAPAVRKSLHGVPPKLRGLGGGSINVLIADRQPVVRAGLRALFDAEDDIAVVGEAADGHGAVAVAQEIRPDVALLDADLRGLDVVEVTRRIADRHRRAGVSVMILAERDTDASLFAGLRAGASGFLVKNTEPADLVEAVRVIATGEALLSPSVARRLIAELASRPQTQLPRAEQLRQLTCREREVVTLVAAGLSDDELAARLMISPATAKTHVTRALGKLDVRNRAQLVAVAYQVGLLQPAQGDPPAPVPTARLALVAA
jgi:DNA-binding NarL/FixJ family response regulator